MLNKKLLSACCLLVVQCLTIGLSADAQPQRNQPIDLPHSTEAALSGPGNPVMAKAQNWVDSVMQQLNPEQRIAQLLMIRTYSNRDDDFNNSIDQLITRFGIGGLCFFQGTASKQKELTQLWQSCSSVPLFVAMDAENGPGMRLTGAFSYPDFMTMGAMANDSLIRVAGLRVGQMCASMGVHINFSPVADVNNNALNPVIHMRSFGELPFQVANKSAAFAQGLQDAGIIATGKHFPGHGDTDSDSHYTLPVLNKERAQLDSTELIPFRRLIDENIGAMMVGHLLIPALDSTKNLAATFSLPVVNTLLKEQLGFQGLIITDGLDMKGATMHFAPGEPSLRALIAGADILLLPSDAPKAIETIINAVADSVITQNQIDVHCRRVLTAKYFYITAKNTVFNQAPEVDASGTPFDRALNRQILKESVTLVTNHNHLLPLRRPDTLTMAVISCGLPAANNFSDMMLAYAPADLFSLSDKPSEKEIIALIDQLSNYNLIIINVVAKSQSATYDYGVPSGTALLSEKLATAGLKTILALFGSPYGAIKTGAIDRAAALIISPDKSTDSQSLCPQMIFGAIPFKAKLPVSLNATFKAGTGIETIAIDRLQYVIPEELGINEHDLKKIDSIALTAIAAGAFPGCQIQLAQKGMVFYQKSFGTPQFGDPSPVKNTDVYDLASLTKVLATTLGVMKLTDEKRIDVHSRLSRYLPELHHSNKEKLRISDIMTHQAGLHPWIPFYKKTVANPKIYYRDSLTADFSIKVANNLYLRTDYKDSILREIITSPVNLHQGYKYSDLGFILLKEATEKITKTPFDKWMADSFYKPLSLNSTGFKPWTRIPSSRIMPTENDVEWRNQLIRGTVHDQAAAMLGGVSGHAGLFGNANDVTIIMQMLLQNGTYGGRRFIEEKTIETFCNAPFASKGNRRGIGFDKSPIVATKNGPVCEEASSESFGHSGFTGTYTWADPSNQLVYTFLSNRICPDASNNKITKLNIRTQIHSLAYHAIEKAHRPKLTTYPESVNPSVLLINISKMGLLINAWR